MTVTSRPPQRGHRSRSRRRASGKARPRVQMSVSISSSQRNTHPPHAFHALAPWLGAAHVHAPASGESLSEGLDEDRQVRAYENIPRTREPQRESSRASKFEGTAPGNSR
jgi:hypothetical protein